MKSTNTSGGGGTAVALFEALWNALASVLGTPATATLLRRAVRGAASSRPDLQGLKGLAVFREELEYRYVLPRSWQQESTEALGALKYLVEEQLAPLLTELTGPIGIRLLERIPELERHGIAREQARAAMTREKDEPR